MRLTYTGVVVLGFCGLQTLADRTAVDADSRTREIVRPVRIVSQSGATGADDLLGHRFGQVFEGRFLAGSGSLLAKGDWLILWKQRGQSL